MNPTEARALVTACCGWPPSQESIANSVCAPFDCGDVYPLLDQLAVLTARLQALEAERLSDIRKIREDEHEKTMRARAERDDARLRLEMMRGVAESYHWCGDHDRSPCIGCEINAILARPATPTEAGG